jgi:N-methylhydantoinase B
VSTAISDLVIPEVIRSSLMLITAELKSVVMRTAHSTSWSEAGDLSCGILNPRGELLAQGERDIPVHLGTMELSVRGALEVIGDDFVPGDIVIHNDPRLGNNHLPDFLFLGPVYDGATLLAYVAVRAHWADVGGSSPGSMATVSTSSFQEGLRVPPMHLVRAGELNQELIRLLLANVRVPDIVLGDLRAQIAGVQRGVERVRSLVRKYGEERWWDTTERILDQGEAMTRAGIRGMRDGIYEFEDESDGDGLSERRPRIKLRLEINGDELVADFTESDPEVLGAINAPFAVTASATYYAVKAFIDPDTPGNSGSYRPIEIRTQKRTIVDASPDSAVAACADTANIIADVLVGALSAAAPERGVAAGAGSAYAFFCAVPRRGGDKSNGLYVEAHGGAWGGRCVGDGISGKRVGVGNVGNQPIEIAEATFPIHTLEYALIEDTAGAGQFRGGLALRRTIRFDEDFTFTMVGERVAKAPYGLAGGQPGSTGLVRINPGTSDEQVLPGKVGPLQLRAGDVVLVQCAAGGGFGDVAARDPEAIRRDIEDGYVTRQGAVEAYGPLVADGATTKDDPTRGG